MITRKARSLRHIGGTLWSLLYIYNEALIGTKVMVLLCLSPLRPMSEADGFGFVSAQLVKNDRNTCSSFSRDSRRSLRFLRRTGTDRNMASKPTNKEVMYCAASAPFCADKSMSLCGEGSFVIEVLMVSKRSADVEGQVLWR